MGGPGIQRRCCRLSRSALPASLPSFSAGPARILARTCIIGGTGSRASMPARRCSTVSRSNRRTQDLESATSNAARCESSPAGLQPLQLILELEARLVVVLRPPGAADDRLQRHV